MRGEMKAQPMARAGLAAALVLAVAVLAGCNRDKVELSQCVGGVAEIARTSDVAPPNC